MQKMHLNTYKIPFKLCFNATHASRPHTVGVAAGVLHQCGSVCGQRKGKEWKMGVVILWCFLFILSASAALEQLSHGKTQ